MNQMILSFIIVLCLGINGCGKSTTIYPELSEGSEAPDFSVKLNNNTIFTLSEKKGKVVLLNFWATWCSVCVEELSVLEKLYEKYQNQVEIIAINSGEDKTTVKSFCKEKDFTVPIGYDEKNEIEKKYPCDGIPYTVIIGKNGKVCDVFTGAKDEESQYKEYRRALKEAVEQ